MVKSAIWSMALALRLAKATRAAPACAVPPAMPGLSAKELSELDLLNLPHFDFVKLF
jgi:hypothetical protein